MKNFETKKRGLIDRIKHLDLLMEVSEGYPKHQEYVNELEKTCNELHELLLKNKQKQKTTLKRVLEFFNNK